MMTKKVLQFSDQRAVGKDDLRLIWAIGSLT